MKTNFHIPGIIWLLVIWSAVPNSGMSQEQTRLTQAVIRGDVRSVKQLLAQGDDLNRTNKAGYTPLMIAVSKANLEIVNALLAEGADVNVKSWYGWNALYSAPIQEKSVI